MKRLIISILLLIGLLSFSASAEARTIRVRGYYKPSTGAYVMPHYKTTPNRTRLDNFPRKEITIPIQEKVGK